AAGGDVVLHAACIVDVVDFSDAEDRNAALFEYIQQHGLGRIDGIVVPPGGAHEIAGRARKRSRDDTTYTMRPIEQLACDFAHSIQLGDWNHVFMCGDLKNAVAGRVNDRLSGADVLFTKFLDDLGP